MLSRIVRLGLRLIPSDAVVRIVRGPLRGMKWIAGSAPHGAWLGRIETAPLRDFSDHLGPDSVVWDIGANVGLYTLAAARRCSGAGQVVAFEPAARNVAFLQRHVTLNGLRHVQVVQAAVSDFDGTAHLASGASPSEYQLSSERGEPVACLTLDSWREQHGAPPPSIVKIDVEGAESAVFAGGERTFTTGRPRIYLAVHAGQAEPCLAILRRWGYRLEAPNGARWSIGDAEWVGIP